MPNAAVRAAIGLVMALAIAGCVPRPHEMPAPPARTAVSPAAVRPPMPAPPVQPPKPRTAAEAGVTAGPPVTSLDLLPDTAAATFASFRTSCRALTRRSDASGLTRPADWLPACTAAAVPGIDPVAFFQQQFETAIVGGGAFFATGYYEPEILGSRTHEPGFDVPIYRRPPDLIEMAVAGSTTRKQRGRMQDGVLIPYYDRATIDNGALAGQGLEIAWAKDPVEFFFLQIQGSGRLLLPDGSVMRIGYDLQNGREYVGLGRLMRDRGLIGTGTGYDTSMQGMMGWMRANPPEAKLLMEEDKSFVFFREITGAGPIGALGVPVIGHVSVAADPMFIPLGAPVWLSADRPEVTGLWVAQDTGGAIKGANRVDTFWGAGVIARITAGGMSARGQAMLLVPRGTIARLTGAAPVGDGGAPARP